MKDKCKKGKFRCWFLALASVASIGALIGCCHRHKTPDEKAAMMLDRLESKLDLDEGQMVIAKEFTNAAKKLMINVKSKRAEDVDNLIKGIDNNNLSAAQLKAIYQSRVSAIDGEIDQLSDSLARLSTTLKEEQKEDLIAILQKIKKHINR